jgi:TonB family protein
MSEIISENNVIDSLEISGNETAINSPLLRENPLTNSIWLPLLLSLGIHGVLAVTMPHLEQKPEVKTPPTVGLVQLTPEQRSRLPAMGPQFSFLNVPTPSNLLGKPALPPLTADDFLPPPPGMRMRPNQMNSGFPGSLPYQPPRDLEPIPVDGNDPFGGNPYERDVYSSNPYGGYPRQSIGPQMGIYNSDYEFPTGFEDSDSNFIPGGMPNVSRLPQTSITRRNNNRNNPNNYNFPPPSNIYNPGINNLPPPPPSIRTVPGEISSLYDPNATDPDMIRNITEGTVPRNTPNPSNGSNLPPANNPNFPPLPINPDVAPLPNLQPDISTTPMPGNLSPSNQSRTPIQDRIKKPVERYENKPAGANNNQNNNPNNNQIAVNTPQPSPSINVNPVNPNQVNPNPANNPSPSPQASDATKNNRLGESPLVSQLNQGKKLQEVLEAEKEVQPVNPDDLATNPSPNPNPTANATPLPSPPPEMRPLLEKLQTYKKQKKDLLARGDISEQQKLAIDAVIAYTEWVVKENLTDQNTTNPRNIANIYPPAACANKLSGNVLIGILVDGTGAVIGQPQILLSSGQEILDNAALTAVNELSFQPNDNNLTKAYQYAFVFDGNNCENIPPAN